MLIRAISILLLLGSASAGCSAFNTTDSQARETLTKAGFSNIRTDGIDWGACGDRDKHGRKFTATNPVGNEVSGVVCCGRPQVFSKACTIRF